MIKCSICSYQCDNWYAFNWRLACHMNFSRGSLVCSLLSQARVLQQHCTDAACSAPFSGNSDLDWFLSQAGKAEPYATIKKERQHNSGISQTSTTCQKSKVFQDRRSQTSLGLYFCVSKLLGLKISTDQLLELYGC